MVRYIKISAGHEVLPKIKFNKYRKFSIPIPKPLHHGEGLCMLCWLGIVQSLWAYTPGIRAGAILLGLSPLDPIGGYAPQPHY